MVSTMTGAMLDLAGRPVLPALGSVAIVALLALMIVRELAAASESPKVQFLGRYPAVGIVPLLFVFGMIVLAQLL